MSDALPLLRVVEALLLLGVANATPILLKRLLGPRLALPVDGGRCLADGRPVFGRAKTLRGVVGAVALTALAGAALGVGAATGAAVGALAMVGDLATSFLKRRLGFAPSARAALLDPLAEALLPLAALRVPLGLSWAAVALATAVFMLAAGPLSRLLYRLRVRDEPH